MRTGVDGETGQLLADASGQRIKKLQAFDLVIKQGQAQRQLGAFRRKNIDGLATHPEYATGELSVVARILHRHQARQDFPPRDLIPAAQNQHHRVVVARVTDTVDARHGPHDDRVPPFKQALGGRQPHLLDVFIDG
ncbi:hypothetical protein D3C73_766660 [compost metagenome]